MSQLIHHARTKALLLLATGLSIIAVALACSAPRTEPARTAKTGAQLWSENCASCHNAHSPGQYSNAQWDVAGRHMRFVANLTGDDSRRIESFLKGGK